MTREAYKDLLREFDAAIADAKSVSRSLMGHSPPERFLVYAEQIFVKLLAHSCTLRDLSPEIDAGPRTQLWDLSSNSTIARSVIDAFDAMAYIALQEVDSQEREFRMLLWELHDTDRRAKMLDSIGSNDSRRAQMAISAREVLDRVTKHPRFAQSSPQLQRKVQEHDAPPYTNTQKERCLANGVHYAFFNSMSMQLSQYVHTLPYAVHHLFAFRAGTDDALRLMSLPLRFALPFLLRATAGTRKLFPDRCPAAPEHILVSTGVWTSILETGLEGAEE